MRILDVLHGLLTLLISMYRPHLGLLVLGWHSWITPLSFCIKICPQTCKRLTFQMSSHQPRSVQSFLCCATHDVSDGCWTILFQVCSNDDIYQSFEKTLSTATSSPFIQKLPPTVPTSVIECAKRLLELLILFYVRILGGLHRSPTILISFRPGTGV